MTYFFFFFLMQEERRSWLPHASDGRSWWQLSSGQCMKRLESPRHGDLCGGLNSSIYFNSSQILCLFIVPPLSCLALEIQYIFFPPILSFLPGAEFLHHSPNKNISFLIHHPYYYDIHADICTLPPLWLPFSIRKDLGDSLQEEAVAQGVTGMCILKETILKSM